MKHAKPIAVLALVMLSGCHAQSSAGVTLANFNSLQIGALYSTATAAFGSPGTITFDGLKNGNHVVTYFWSNPDGSNVSLIFQNDKLLLKIPGNLK